MGDPDLQSTVLETGGKNQNWSVRAQDLLFVFKNIALAPWFYNDYLMRFQ